MEDANYIDDVEINKSEDENVYHVVSKEGAFVGWVEEIDGVVGFNQESGGDLLSQNALRTIIDFMDDLEALPF